MREVSVGGSEAHALEEAREAENGDVLGGGQRALRAAVAGQVQRHQPRPVLARLRPAHKYM